MGEEIKATSRVILSKVRSLKRADLSPVLDFSQNAGPAPQSREVRWVYFHFSFMSSEAIHYLSATDIS